MQYFSFLGTGTNQQYSIADYHLENSHEVVKTEFVQEAISRLNYNQIDEVYDYVRKSQKRHLKIDYWIILKKSPYLYTL